MRWTPAPLFWKCGAGVRGVGPAHSLPRVVDQKKRFFAIHNSPAFRHDKEEKGTPWLPGVGMAASPRGECERSG
jgi:hypothetical protein